MTFNDHSKLKDTHAFFSPSQPAWSNYDQDKIERVFISKLAAAEGTRKHKLAQLMIMNGVKAEDTQQTFNMYVNDCIGFRMDPEVTFFKSFNFFGHADAASYRDNKFKCFDLKTGETPTTFRQLEIYTALFCIEYDIRPFHLDEIELRIYQNDERKIFFADPAQIFALMDWINFCDDRIETLRKEMQ